MPKHKGRDELVRIAAAPNPVIAASWQELLRAEGIPSMVRVDDPLGVAYQVSSIYACDIFVAVEHAGRAKELLDELVGDVDEGDFCD